MHRCPDDIWAEWLDAKDGVWERFLGTCSFRRFMVHLRGMEMDERKIQTARDVPEAIIDKGRPEYLAKHPHAVYRRLISQGASEALAWLVFGWRG